MAKTVCPPKIIFSGNREVAAKRKGDALSFWQFLINQPGIHELGQYTQSQVVNGALITAIFNNTNPYIVTGMLEVFYPETGEDKTGVWAFVYIRDGEQYILKAGKDGFVDPDKLFPTAHVGRISWTDYNKTLISWNGLHRYTDPNTTAGTPPKVYHDNEEYNFRTISARFPNYPVVGAALKGSEFVFFQIMAGALFAGFATKTSYIAGLIYIVGGITLKQHVCVSPDCSKAVFSTGDSIIDLAIDWGAYSVSITSTTSQSVNTTYNINIADSSVFHTGTAIWQGYFGYPGESTSFKRRTKTGIDYKELIVAVDYGSDNLQKNLVYSTIFWSNSVSYGPTTYYGDKDPRHLPTSLGVLGINIADRIFYVEDNYTGDRFEITEADYLAYNAVLFSTTFWLEEITGISESEIFLEAKINNEIVSEIYKKTKTPGSVARKEYTYRYDPATFGVIQTIVSTTTHPSLETTIDTWKHSIITDADLRINAFAVTEITRNGWTGSDSYNVNYKYHVGGAGSVGVYTAETISFAYENYFLHELGGTDYSVQQKIKLFDVYAFDGGMNLRNIGYSGFAPGFTVIDRYKNLMAFYQYPQKIDTSYTASLVFIKKPVVFMRKDKNEVKKNSEITDLKGVI